MANWLRFGIACYASRSVLSAYTCLRLLKKMYNNNSLVLFFVSDDAGSAKILAIEERTVR